jgi:hypothetical protein
MAKRSLHFGGLKLRASLVLGALILCLPCAFAILDWLAHLSLSPDSTTYIVVAKNLLETGHLFFFADSTDWVGAPTVVPYRDQPPGLPLLLVPFIAVLRDPMISAAVAQSFYLVLFYLAIYLTTLRLKFTLPLRAAALILFTFVAPLRLIRQYFWSETLFIALSIAAGCIAVSLLTGTNRKRDWILLLILLAFSSAVRFSGVANLGLIAPLLLKRDTARAAMRLLAQRYLSTAILVTGGLLLILSLLIDTLRSANPGIGPLQWSGILAGAAGLLIGSAGLVVARRRLSRENQSESPETESDARKSAAHVWAVFAVVAAVAPVLIWFARNQLSYGVITPTNRLFQSFQGDRLWGPFEYVWTGLLNIGRLQRPLLAMLVVVLLLLPLLRRPLLGMGGFRRTAQIVILSGAIAHFSLLWSLSLVTNMQSIGDRIFSPVLAFTVLGLVNGLQQAVDIARPRVLKQALSALPLVALVAAGTFSSPELWQSLGNVNYPRERQLWSEINSIDWTRSSSYFYSDGSYGAGGYIHQIFSGRPQGIIRDPNVLRDPEMVHNILSNGVNPFILVTESGYEAGILNEMSASGAVPLERMLFHDTGFALYYLGR